MSASAPFSLFPTIPTPKPAGDNEPRSPHYPPTPEPEPEAATAAAEPDQEEEGADPEDSPRFSLSSPACQDEEESGPAPPATPEQEPAAEFEPAPAPAAARARASAQEEEEERERHAKRSREDAGVAAYDPAGRDTAKWRRPACHTCHMEPATRVLMPCLHVCLCEACHRLNLVGAWTGPCPVCQQQVHNTFRLNF